MILVLGGLTLIFHNPWFIKWKPTVIYWLSAIIILFTASFNSKSLIQKLMENNIQLPAKIWKRLNYSWVIFFILMGSLNIYIAYHFDTNTWVNFKLFGGSGCLIIFILIQAFFLTRYQMPSSNRSHN